MQCQTRGGEVLVQSRKRGGEVLVQSRKRGGDVLVQKHRAIPGKEAGNTARLQKLWIIFTSNKHGRKRERETAEVLN